ncbi:kelch repeat and BTB domain-containing protein 8-like isoform X1 [Branchiostoma floridae x Branchiostoma japonicum]
MWPRFSMKKKITYIMDLSQPVQGNSGRLQAFQNRTGEECKGRTGFGTFKNHHRGPELLRELARQYKNGEFVDVVVKVEGKEFRCHRAVLASMPFFRTMLSSNFTESRSGVVQLHDVNPDSFSKILDFLYHGKLCITKDDVESLVQAAHMLQLEKVLDYCKTFMVECLSPSNCLGVMHLAGSLDMTTLKREARYEALSRFAEVVQTEEFLCLSAEVLLYLLEDDELHVSDEDDIANAVVRWLSHKGENRKAALPTIFQEIRLSHVRVGVLEMLASHPLVQQSPQCLVKITTAKEEHLRGAWQLSTGTARGQGPRRGISDDLAIVVGGWRAVKQSNPREHEREHRPNVSDLAPESEPQQTIFCLNPDDRQYYHITKLPTLVTRCVSVASEGRHLYVTGGQDPATSMFSLPPPSRQAFRYDFPTDTWMTLPDMPRGRAGHQSIVVGGKLFLVGGHDEDKSQFSMDCYNIREGAWIKPPTLPAIDASSDFTATACNGKLLIVQVSQKIATNPTVDSAQSSSEYPILYVHAYDVATDRAVYAVVPLKSAVRKENIWTTAVEDKLYLYLFEGHPDHGDYLQNRNKIYAYDTKEGSLCKVNVVNGAGLTGSFIRTQQQGMTSFVLKHTFKGRVRIKGIIETKVCIPFALEGHTCLGVKKSGIGWYCRDKLQTLRDKEVEDVAPKAESSASGSAGT